MQEKKKSLEALKPEERKVAAVAFEGLTLLEKKKIEDDARLKAENGRKAKVAAAKEAKPGKAIDYWAKHRFKFKRRPAQVIGPGEVGPLAAFTLSIPSSAWCTKPLSLTPSSSNPSALFLCIQEVASNAGFGPSPARSAPYSLHIASARQFPGWILTRSSCLTRLEVNLERRHDTFSQTNILWVRVPYIINLFVQFYFVVLAHPWIWKYCGRSHDGQ